MDRTGGYLVHDAVHLLRYTHLKRQRFISDKGDRALYAVALCFLFHCRLHTVNALLCSPEGWEYPCLVCEVGTVRPIGENVGSGLALFTPWI